MIDVRDTAAHHVAAYEKGVEGRFFSTTEAWHWTLVYEALKLHCPHIKDWPMPLPRGTKLLPVREYSKTRMNVLGIKERSMLKLLGDAVKELEQKQLFKGFTYFEVAGYYDLGSGNGQFLMVHVTAVVDYGGSYTTIPQISYVTGSMTEPAVYKLPHGSLLGTGTGDFALRLNGPGKPILDLNFQTKSGGLQMAVNGSIDGTPVTGLSYITSTPLYAYNGTYVAEDKSDSVTFAFGPGTNNSITFSDGSKVEKFECDPIKRRFSFSATNSTGVDFKHRLYMNVGGCGLNIKYVQFDPKDPKNTASTKVYVTKTEITYTSEGPKNGAALLATLAGYYPLSFDGSRFVSILGSTEAPLFPVVSVCTDGTNSTLYGSFTFQNNTLTFPSPEAPSITFDALSDKVSVNVVLPDGTSFYGENDFSVAPFEAFGHQNLSTSPNSTSIASLSINPEDDQSGQSRLILTKDGSQLFNTTDYQYDPVQQAVGIIKENFQLNFCYNPKKGVTCGVTKRIGGGFNCVLYAYP